MKRSLDLVLALVVGAVVILPALVVALIVRFTSPGPIFYWSDRVGVNNQLFAMPKFRTMRVDTPAMATHLLADAGNFLTPVGGFLRRSSLDEIPQLLSILAGNMSFVGPRPALFNQDDLIALRTAAGVHQLRPGLTGLAQIGGRDLLTIEEKVALDITYMRTHSLMGDLRILFLTGVKVLHREGVSH
jgi:O-antigen biosynthesis protein WbqP